MRCIRCGKPGLKFCSEECEEKVEYKDPARPINEWEKASPRKSRSGLTEHRQFCETPLLPEVGQSDLDTCGGERVPEAL